MLHTVAEAEQLSIAEWRAWSNQRSTTLSMLCRSFLAGCSRTSRICFRSDAAVTNGKGFTGGFRAMKTSNRKFGIQEPNLLFP
jgi:hypothetical protein